MREILFRGKSEEYGKWVYGGFCEAVGNYPPMIYSKEDTGLFDINQGIPVISETVCQYIGLTDKNGKEIFEGDVVRLPKCENDTAVFAIRGCNYFLKGNRSNYELGNCDSECFEIVGNILDNPELIKKGRG